MNQTVTIPTTRDEAWRYADSAALAAADPGAVDEWRTFKIEPGGTLRHLGEPTTGGIERWRIDVGAGGCYAHFAVLDAGDYARREIEVTLGEGASFEFGGVVLGTGEATREFVTRVIHAEPGAMSKQVVRAVAADRSVANFLGRIEVARDAQQTDAAQNFRAILLNDGATANAKPELEIFADDVKCAHGAAIGALDEAAAFYMAARGVPPEEARALLIRAFIADAFGSIEDTREQETMISQALASYDHARLRAHV
ncbi:SufD family Fe-S cluster assembly protein [Novosphingobium aquimarinum]|uniref:SufD family Fe-S cluster assembly protein n=1 Tax=Novosphingobium aquimarinum TaxID=2682494 RepID=UPI0012ECA3FE|nr:SufD family Fe-S cluster assembly protein [Novosphingobium aquimarinum]